MGRMGRMGHGTQNASGWHSSEHRSMDLGPTSHLQIWAGRWKEERGDGGVEAGKDTEIEPYEGI